MEQELISIPFEEGKIDALFYYADKGESQSEKEPVIIHVHGFLGNFLDGSQRFLPPLLAKAGYSSLSINTRLANFGLFFGYGLLDDTLPQIDRTIEFLNDLGYKKVMISGYSLGGSVILRYAALRNNKSDYENIKGVIAIATPYSLPDSIRRRWNKWGSQPSYDEVYREAKEILKTEPTKSSEDRTILIFKARGDTFKPEHSEIYTYKTWWFLAVPEAESAMSFKQIEKINIPVLLIQGWYDDVVDSKETNDLAQAAINAGNKDVSTVFVDAGHTLEEKEEELGDIIIRWLDKRFLST
ncbi:MAG: alpha/beta hydrolase family protein [Thermodesulfobacteriota bacterium]